MSVSSRALIELVLLGPTNDRRQLQDSPVLGDVWIEYALNPTKAIDLLITPDRLSPAGPVAVHISDRIPLLQMARSPDEASQIAYLQGLVAARLFFAELLRVVIPMTNWWNEKKIQKGIQAYIDGTDSLRDKVEAILKWATAQTEDERTKAEAVFATFDALDRYASLAAVVLWASDKTNNPGNLGAGDAISQVTSPDLVVKALRETFDAISNDPKPDNPDNPPRIWQVSLNRKASPALERSVPSVKGDAARTLFNVKCDSITWAVLDSGIDGKHPVFKDKNGKSRIKKAFDFSNIRRIVSLDNLQTNTPAFDNRLDDLLRERAEKLPKAQPLSKEDGAAYLQKLAEDAKRERPIHWELVEKFIEIDPETPPKSVHGTHVAGIIGGYAKPDDESGFASGMAPDIKFYDFRVLAKTLEDTEFAIIAALQFLRYLNEKNTYLSIHGANLSLSIPHDVRNFACGRTPICIECERLVEGGVVVVAAAGNLGYQRFETKDGSYEGYTAFSITDPGNADGVITVGATHRFKPHTYGVSFFSSRGPTGDGRLKPDLVAPGERIESSLPEEGWGELDGTSMAAPHVSGAAAMLMARYDELIGEPRRIKEILCQSATDLGRERSFQGHGMLDVLRAFQSV
jgi:serine protease AprX